MKTTDEHRVDLDEKILKEPVEELEKEYQALKAEYHETEDESVKAVLVSTMFELASMYHEIGNVMEAHRVFDEICHYDKSQEDFISKLKEMEPDNIDAFKEATPEDKAKYQQLIALTAAAGEGVYSKSDFTG